MLKKIFDDVACHSTSDEAVKFVVKIDFDHTLAINLKGSMLLAI